MLTGTQSAVAGGFTAVACMANTNPVNDNGSVTRYIIETSASSKPGARLSQLAPCRKDSRRELADIGEMARAGAVAISDDGRPVMDANLDAPSLRILFDVQRAHQRS